MHRLLPFLVAVIGCAPPRAAQLASPMSFSAGRSPSVALPADFNGDGRPDLVVTRSSGGGGLVALLGMGDGTFRQSMSTVGNGLPSAPAIADFNGDGKLDVAVTGLAGPGLVSVLLGRGDGSFAEPVQHIVGGSAGSPKAGDFNGDGKIDLALVRTRAEGNDVSGYMAGQLVLLFGRGDGSFESARATDLGLGVHSMAVADLDGDHVLDLVVADQRNTLYILMGAGNGSFRALERMHVEFQPLGIVAADVNRDKVPDLVLGVDRGVSVLLGRGDGSFTPAGDYIVEQTRSAWAVDLDKDGNVDLVTARRVLRGDGTGHFVPMTLPHRVNDDSFVAAADFNGDGWPDLAATDAEHGEINIYLNVGAARLAAR
jgi:VCBS repeat protein/FG-GAP repeat protein